MRLSTLEAYNKTADEPLKTPATRRRERFATWTPP